MRIGVKFEDHYAISEFFQLLKVDWEWYKPNEKYDVVIARKSEVSEYHGNLIDLDDQNNLNAIVETIQTLQEGAQHAHIPISEINIDRIRSQLKRYGVLAEILPSPWGHPYIFVPTHDVDNISVRQASWRTAILMAIRCLVQNRIDYTAKFILCKLDLVKDPWDLFTEWIEMESALGIRSTFFLIPPHFKTARAYNRFRETSYHVGTSPERIVAERNGWEFGVHGFNGWNDSVEGWKERMAAGYAGGNRTHWLLRDKDSWNKLDAAGYCYDATFGEDENVSFKAGTAQVFKPRGSERLLVLPLEIQDAALFGKTCWILQEDPDLSRYGSYIRYPCMNLTETKAMGVCCTMLNEMLKYGGVISVLWHYENLIPPRNLKQFYIDLIKRAQKDGALITTAIDAVEWFQRRRDASVKVVPGEHGFVLRVSPNAVACNPPSHDTVARTECICV